MKAVVTIDETVATFAAGAWSCRDPGIAEALNRTVPAGGFSPSDPTPERTAAEEAARCLGATIVAIGAPENFKEGIVY